MKNPHTNTLTKKYTYMYTGREKRFLQNIIIIVFFVEYLLYVKKKNIIYLPTPIGI